MKKFVRWLFAGLILFALGGAAWLTVGLLRPLDPIPKFGRDAARLAFVDATVIDIDTGAAMRGQTVIVDGGIIKAVGPARNVRVPPGTTTITATGKYLIPGLWDAHLHTLDHSPRLHFPLLLAHGITSARDLGDGCSWSEDLDCIPSRQNWASLGTNAARLTPYFADTSSYHFEESFDAAGTRRVLEAIRARGDSLVKLQLPDDGDPESFRAMMTEARSAGMPIAGHVPRSLDLTDPHFPSFASIEHSDQLLDQCHKLANREASAVEECTVLLERMARDQTAFVPTFVASTGQDLRLGSEPTREAEELRFAPSPIAAIWRVYRRLHIVSSDGASRQAAQIRHRQAGELTVRAHRAGVRVLAGSDALDPFIMHGSALHDELESLVEAGLTPFETLRAATILSAEHDGSDMEIGRIAPGYRADLLLLASNPLDNINAASDLDFVYTRQMLVDRAEIQRLKDFTYRQSQSHALNARLWWALIAG